MGEGRPHRFGNYQLIRRLAQGGMAEIWLAKDVEQPDRDVVIKQIHQHLVADDQFLMMFLDEAKIAARLDHPGCVQIFDLGCHAGSYYLAMEYIHGEDIRSIARQARKRSVPLPRKLAVEIVAGAAEGLHYAHELRDSTTGLALNVVHRDVSPQNILVTYAGDVKIVDFGIAKAADQANRTQAGVLKGKYAYMSPEQVLGVPLDRRSDVFALGVLLYELTTGKRLFKAATELESMRRITKGVILPPTVASPGYPPKLESIVLRALARERDERWDSADTFQRELRGFLAAHSCSISRSDVSKFMTSLFADRIEAEAAASAVGDQEAFLRARFGEDSVSSVSKKHVADIDIEIDLDASGEDELEKPTRDPPYSPKAPAGTGRPVSPRLPPAPTSAPQAASLDSPVFEPATNPTIDLHVSDLRLRASDGESGFADEQGNPEFDRTDPIRTYSEIFAAGPPPDVEPPRPKAVRQQPRGPTLGASSDYGTTVSGMDTSPGGWVDAFPEEPSPPAIAKRKEPSQPKAGKTALLAVAGLVVIGAGVLFATTWLRSGAASSSVETGAASEEAGPTAGESPRTGAETERTKTAPDGLSTEEAGRQAARAATEARPHGTESVQAAESGRSGSDGSTSPEPEPATEATLAVESPSPGDADTVAADPGEDRPSTRPAATRRPPQQPAPPAAPRQGFVTITADAPGVAILGGEEIGPLPVQRHALAPGRYTFLIRGDEVEQRVSADVVAGRTVTRTVSLKMGLLRVTVRPWAEVYVDGRHIGTTPFAPVRIPAGTHTLEARNPDLDARRRVPFVLEPDGEILLSIDLLEE